MLKTLKVYQTAVIAVIIFIYLGHWLSPSSRETASMQEDKKEAQERADSLEKEARNRAGFLEKENLRLQEENARLRTQLVAFTGPTGMSIEEWQRVLDDRKAVLDQRERNLVDREIGISQRDEKIAKEEQEFYEKTNMTMIEIGEAKQIRKEYEEMKQDRKKALQTADRWLRFIWILSAALALTCFGFLFALVKLYFAHRQQEIDLEQRRNVANLFVKAAAAKLSEEQAVLMNEALHRLAQLEYLSDQ